MVHVKDAVFWDLSGERDKGRIPIKRKAISLDCQTSPNYGSDHYFVAEEYLGTDFGATSKPSEKRQKILVDDAEGNPRHAVLSSSEKFREIIEPKSYDTANSFKENSRNHISTCYIQESTSSSGTSHPTATLDFGQFAVPSSSPSTSQHGPRKETPLPNEGLAQEMKPQKSKSTVKSTRSASPKARRFRCFHNALDPAIFCADQETPEKFRTCAGPGWKKMQHCQEHMYKYHSKQVKKPKPLQCSVCLGEFLDVEELRSHTDSVDCPPRCLECNEIFSSKILRLEHQKLSHFEGNAEGPYMELDEKKKKEIKEALKYFKSYSELLKKGKCDPKPELEDWIKANTVLYEDGRSDEEKAKARMELGYWYTIYTTLAPETKILEHPFYNATTIPHIYMELERILNLNESVVKSRIETHGPPPTDLDRQLEWYRDSLRDTLQRAGRMIKTVTHTQPSVSAAPMSMSQSAQDPASNSRQRSLTSDFDLYTNGGFSVALSPTSPNSFPEMGVSLRSYVSSVQTVSTLTGGPNSLSDSFRIDMGMSMNQDSGYNTNDFLPGDFGNHYSSIW